MAEHDVDKLVAAQNRPCVVTIFMPGCPHCSAPHPKAFSHWQKEIGLANALALDPDICPRCGCDVDAAGKPKLTRGRLHGFWGAIANWLFDRADAMLRLAKRFEL